MFVGGFRAYFHLSYECRALASCQNILHNQSCFGVFRGTDRASFKRLAPFFTCFTFLTKKVVVGYAEQIYAEQIDKIDKNN